MRKPTASTALLQACIRLGTTCPPCMQTRSTVAPGTRCSSGAPCSQRRRWRRPARCPAAARPTVSGCRRDAAGAQLRVCGCIAASRCRQAGPAVHRQRRGASAPAGGVLQALFDRPPAGPLPLPFPLPAGESNLVFIANDWHTALLPVYLQASGAVHTSMHLPALARHPRGC